MKWAKQPTVEIYLGKELLDAETVIRGKEERSDGSSNVLARILTLQVTNTSKEALRDFWVSFSVPREMKSRIFAKEILTSMGSKETLPLPGLERLGREKSNQGTSLLCHHCK